MRAKFERSGHALKIDFCRPEASWALLVIDDRCDLVNYMIYGLVDPLTRTDLEPALFDRCLNETEVDGWWNSFTPSDQVFDKALVLLPCILFNEVKAMDIGAVTFVPFITNVDDLGKILQFAAETGSFTRSIACLLDVWDSTMRKQRFISVWQMLDELNHPMYARARFTFGGVPATPEGVTQIKRVIKELDDGNDRFKNNLLTWIDEVRGIPSNRFFQNLTMKPEEKDDACHKPTEMLNASLTARKSKCEALVKQDCSGVWNWAKELVCKDSPNIEAAFRWLCAKAFQTSELCFPEVPLTAVIGICEGARFLEPELMKGYIVTNNLPKVSLSTIDSLWVYGSLILKEAAGNYPQFASALRDWIINREQFVFNNSHIVSVAINTVHQTASLIFKYSSPLPSCIFSPKGRRGRTTRLWERLKCFAETTDYKENTIILNFNLSLA